MSQQNLIRCVISILNWPIDKIANLDIVYVKHISPSYFAIADIELVYMWRHCNVI